MPWTWTKEADEGRKTYRRRCPLCGEDFTAYASNVVYCSDECRRLMRNLEGGR